MSFNVRHFNKYDWIPKSKIDGDFKNFFKNNSTDILCIQEYNSNNYSVFSNLYDSKNIDYKNSETNLAIFSNFKEVNIYKEKNNTKSFIFKDLIIKNDTIRVFNVHLASNWFNQSEHSFIENPTVNANHLKSKITSIIERMKNSYKKRAIEVIKIRKIIDSSPYPIIICGDFNDTPVSFAYNLLTSKLIDSFSNSGRGIGYSYVKIPFLRIDYILHDNNITSFNYKVHKKNLSDHYPISCKIKINNP